MSIKTLTVRPKQLYGIDESLDESLQGWNVASEAVNVDLSNGVIETAKGYTEYGSTAAFNIVKLFIWRASGIGLYSVLYGDDKARVPVLIAGCQYTESGLPVLGVFRWYIQLSAGWDLITTDGTTAAMTSVNPSLAHVESYTDDDTDVLLIAGGVKHNETEYTRNSLYKLYKQGTGDFRAAAIATAPIGSNGIAMHKERIWVSGRGFTGETEIPSDQNTVYYSNAFDPDDWTTAGEAGILVIETFDADAITGIANLLDDVVIFKTNTIHRVTGDIPSEYATEQIYAVEGALFPESICGAGGRSFFAGSDGIYEYLGIETRELLTDRLKETMKNITSVRASLFYGGVIYLSCTITGTGNAVIEYDLNAKTLVIKEINAASISLYSYSGLKTILFPNGTNVYRYNLGEDYDGADIDMAYTTPKSVIEKGLKTLDFVKFIGQCTAAADGSTGDVKVTIYCDTKTKEKTLTLTKTQKEYKIRVGKRGRIFGLKFENVDGSIIRIADFSAHFMIEEDL